MLNTLTAVWQRVYLTTTAQFIGNVVVAHSVALSDIGGFYVAPFAIPSDMRREKPSNIYVHIAPLLAPLAEGESIRLKLETTIIHLDRTITEHVVELTWPLPAFWLPTQPERVLIDDGLSQTYAPNTFSSEDFIGLRISRQGPHAADTFDRSLKFADSLDLQYRATDCP